MKSLVASSRPWILGVSCLALGACGSHMAGHSAVASSSALTAANACPDAIGDSVLTGKPPLSVTHGQVAAAAAGSLAYTVTSGYMPIYALGTQAGPVRGCMFYFAYTRDDHATDPKWPVAFVFNGGPGSPSDWVHLGGLGPKTMNFGPEGLDTSSAAIGDDSLTLLANTDLVFIDPINTGYSRPAQGVDQTVFNGLEQDADSIGDFIQGYLTASSRTASPKYVIGESYAGMRIPVLGRYLDEKLGIKLAGVMFISPWLDAIGDDESDAADDLPYATFLPEFAATAWYHHKLPGSFQAMSARQVYAAAKAFADGPYLTALGQGDDLPADQRSAVAATLSELTGLPAEFINTNNLRVTLDQFRVNVLKDTGESVSYYDGRKHAVVADPTTQDPFDAFNPLFTTTDTSYFGTTLGIATDLPYASSNWTSWPGAVSAGGISGGYLTVLEDINTLLTNNPELNIGFASGLFDFACPAAEVEFMVRHLHPEVAKRIQVRQYLSGHPVYFGGLSHAQFSADMTAFLAAPAGSSSATPPVSVATAL